MRLHQTTCFSFQVCHPLSMYQRIFMLIWFRYRHEAFYVLGRHIIDEVIHYSTFGQGLVCTLVERIDLVPQ